MITFQPMADGKKRYVVPVDFGEELHTVLHQMMPRANLKFAPLVRQMVLEGLKSELAKLYLGINAGTAALTTRGHPKNKRAGGS